MKVGSKAQLVEPIENAFLFVYDGPESPTTKTRMIAAKVLPHKKCKKTQYSLKSWGPKYDLFCPDFVVFEEISRSSSWRKNSLKISSN